MANYLISYDLLKPGQDYASLSDAIKRLATTWWHHLDSTWLVVTSLSCQQVRDAIGAHLDSNDKLLVVELKGVAAWRGIPANGSDWLKANI